MPKINAWAEADVQTSSFDQTMKTVVRSIEGNTLADQDAFSKASMSNKRVTSGQATHGKTIADLTQGLTNTMSERKTVNLKAS